MVSLQRGVPRSDKDQPFSVGVLVMYDHDSASLLGVILGEKKGKYTVLNERGREIELPSNRLHKVPGTISPNLSTTQAKIDFLSKLHEEAKENAKKLAIDELWNFVKDEPKDYDISYLTELYLGENSLNNHLSLRVALLLDKVFFKRVKDFFIPRSESTIEELKHQEEIRHKKLALMELGTKWLLHKKSDPSAQCPKEFIDYLKLLESVAADSPHIDQSLHKDAIELLDNVTDKLSLPLGGSHSDRAYRLLIAIHHFNQLTNLSLIRHRIRKDFSKEVLEAAQNVEPRTQNGVERIDLTHIETFTIDDESTKDMDDAFSLIRENNQMRLYIHITDVAASIEPNTPLDKESKNRGTSLYLPEQNIPMLPSAISYEALSLREGLIRQCITCVFTINDSFEALPESISPSLVKVTKRLTYSKVDELLFSDTEPFATVNNIAAAFEAYRIENGGFRVQKRDISLKVSNEGEVKIEELDEAAPSRALVGELMVMANAFIASFCSKNNIPIPYRVQELPDDEDLSSIPSGPAYDFAIRTSLKRSLVSFTPSLHATLGLSAYTQATSPIRRYLDLVIQRQLLGFLRSGKPYYSHDEIVSIQSDVEEVLNAANLASRESKKYWILKYLEQRMKRSKKIEATVVRIEGRNPLVELDEVYITLPIKMDKTPELGKRIEATISSIDPKNDYVRLEGKVIN